MPLPFIIGLILLFLQGFLAGCATTRVVTVPAPIVESAPMPASCRADAQQGFVAVRKRPGGQTRPEDVLAALQGNKAVLAQNRERAQACECWLQQDRNNAADKVRLKSVCRGDPRPRLEENLKAEGRIA